MIWFFRREIIFLLAVSFSLLIMGKASRKSAGEIRSGRQVEKRINYDELVAENMRLRKILGLKEKGKYSSRFRIGNVVSVRPHVFPVEMVINKGSADGIREGMAVLSKDLCLVGRISGVSQKTSRIITIFNTVSKISVMVDSTGEVGIMEGGTIPHCILKYISRESKVKVGDTIVTSGYSKFFPRGTRVGEVVNISPATDSLFLNIHVKPYTGTDEVDEVLIGE